MKRTYERITGIGDEGGSGIKEQIANHIALGWNTIELRNVDGRNVCEVDDPAFESIYAQMSEAGFTAAGFGSAIANWARPVTIPFERDVHDLKRAIPRMRRLDTRFIRIMSYPNDKLPEDEWKREVFRRIRELVTIAEGEGVVLLHENCDGWASGTPEHLAELLSTIDSPSLRVVFDTGNPVSHGGDRGTTWEFYRAALPYIAHFHMKDCKIAPDGSVEHTMPGDGSCEVKAIMNHLCKTGYTGLFSIEPHIATQVHLGGTATAGLDQRGIYLEYGRRMNGIWDEITHC